MSLQDTIQKEVRADLKLNGNARSTLNSHARKLLHITSETQLQIAIEHNGKTETTIVTVDEEGRFQTPSHVLDRLSIDPPETITAAAEPLHW
jgi:hypothetical protein